MATTRDQLAAGLAAANAGLQDAARRLDEAVAATADPATVAALDGLGVELGRAVRAVQVAAEKLWLYDQAAGGSSAGPTPRSGD